MSVLRRIAERLAQLYRREPARINAYVAGLVTAGLLRLGFHVDDTAVAVVVPIVLSAVAGELTRTAVTPATKTPED